MPVSGGTTRVHRAVRCERRFCGAGTTGVEMLTAGRAKAKQPQIHERRAAQVCNPEGRAKTTSTTPCDPGRVKKHHAFQPRPASKGQMLTSLVNWTTLFHNLVPHVCPTGLQCDVLRGHRFCLLYPPRMSQEELRVLEWAPATTEPLIPLHKGRSPLV